MDLKIIEDAWLDLDIADKDIFNPATFLKPSSNDFHLQLTYLLMQPDYLAFLCKELLNIQLLPFQCLVLQEMWSRKFPMLIASRGAGKSFILSVYSILRAILFPNRKIVIVGAAFRQSKVLFEYMENIWNNSPLLRDMYQGQDNGPKKDTDRCLLQLGDSKIICLPLGDGCLSGDTLITTESCIRYINQEFTSGKKLIIPRELNLFCKDKLVMSDEAYCNGIADTIKIVTSSGFSIEGTLNHKVLTGRGMVELQHITQKDYIKIDCSEKWPTKNSSLAENHGYIAGLFIIRNQTPNTSIPNKILCSSKPVMTNFLRSIFDEKGRIKLYKCSGKNEISVSLPSISQKLIKQIQYILTHYGIVSSIKEQQATHKMRYFISMSGTDAIAFNEKIGFSSTEKSKLFSLLLDKRTIQSKSKIKNDTYTDKVKTIEKGRTITYDMHVPEGHLYGANGLIVHNTKIRGQRANDIIADEFACLRANTLVQTDYGLLEISDYLNGEAYSLMNKDSEFEYPDTIFRTPKTDVYKITTQYGYYFECSEKHQVMTQDGWKIAKDLIPNEDRLEIDFNSYFPENTVVDKDTAWLLGLIISEGNCTNRNFFSIKNTDKELIDLIQSRVNIDWCLYHKDSYVDKRGWNCKESWELKCNNTEYRDKLKDYGLDYNISINKTFPKGVLLSNRESVLAFLSGMYEGDGSAFYTENRGKKEFQVVLYSSSPQLLETTQKVLLKFGVLSSVNSRDVGTDNLNYRLVTRGDMAARLFSILEVLKWRDIVPPPEQKEKTPQIKKISDNKYRVATTYGNRNHYLGTCSSEEECFKRFEEFYKNKRELLIVKSVEKLPEQEVLYDFHMPKTNSFIGNGFIQHNSIPRDIFETVVSGFGVVKPNTIQSVQKAASKKKAEALGVVLEDEEENYTSYVKDNQIIFSGTAYYDFNHFASYWKKWKAIIQSGGDDSRLKNVFGGEDPPKNFDWHQYSIIRLPYELLPDGFMDAAQVARSKATVHTGIYAMEFGAVFTRDSQGFFKRSLIESCVTGHDKNIVDNNGQPIIFESRLIGDYGKQYVFGVDPASEVDNFSIVVLEINPDHRRVAYCWTTTRSDHIEKVKRGQVKEKDFYSYCSRKIRDLMKLFPCARIAMDAQGGGVAIMEALHSSNKLSESEHLIWPIIDPNKKNPWDNEKGLHILEMCQFANYEWYSEANHSLRKDLEDKVLLFPRFDTVTLGISNAEDGIKGRTYDTLEDCVMEIEELKNELSTIQMTQTSNGRDRWDTPEIIVAAGKKSKMRKDRYSALLMANMSARILSRIPTKQDYEFYGGFAHMSESSNKKKSSEDYFVGPAWFTEKMKDVYDIYD